YLQAGRTGEFVVGNSTYADDDKRKLTAGTITELDIDRITIDCYGGNTVRGMDLDAPGAIISRHFVSQFRWETQGRNRLLSEHHVHLGAVTGKPRGQFRTDESSAHYQNSSAGPRPTPSLPIVRK